MAQLSRQQVQQILDNAPYKADKTAILDGLVKRGFELEGVDTNVARQRIQKVEQGKQAEASNIFVEPEPTSIGDVLGTERGAVTSRVGDVGSDIQETGTSIKQNFADFRQNQRDASQINQSSASDLYQASAGALKFLGDSVFDIAVGAVKTTLTPKQEQLVESKFQEGVEGLEQATRGTRGREAISSMVAGWNSFAEKHPEAAGNITATAQIAEVLTDVLGFKLGKKVTKEAVDTATDVINKTSPVIDKVPTKPEVPTVKTPSGGNVPATEDIAGKILQSTPETRPTGVKALSAVDTQGVKTYKDLNERISAGINNTREEMDDYLRQFPETYDAQGLAKYSNVGGKTVVETPVLNALDELELHYTKINNPAKAEEIIQLRNKLGTEGLNALELNDLARLHGRDLNSYNANGELASGLTKQAVESTRRGVKDVVRNRLPDDTAREFDAQMSDMLDTIDLTKKVETKVNALTQKLKDRSLTAKIGGALFEIVDLLSVGTARGFIQKSLPSNVGNKTANFLDIEKSLEKNLSDLNRLLEIEDPKVFEKAVLDFIEKNKTALKVGAVGAGVGATYYLTTEGDINAAPLIGIAGMTLAPKATRKTVVKQLGKALDSDTLDELQSFSNVIKQKGVNTNRDGKLTFKAIDGMNEAEVKEAWENGIKFVEFDGDVTDLLAQKKPAEIAKFYDEVLEESADSVPKKKADIDTPDLSTEAKKYKSADEFVEAQGTTVYHGSSKIIDSVDDINFKDEAFYTLRKTDKDMQELIDGASERDYFTPEDLGKMPAEAFGKNVNEFVVDFKNPLIVDAKGRSWMDTDGEWSDWTNKQVKKATNTGNDGVIIRNINEGFSSSGTLGAEAGLVDDYIVLNKDAIKTRRELESIWEDAQK